VESIRAVVRVCPDLGVRHLTLYAFSEENWRRPKLEVEGLMRLLKVFLEREIKALDQEGVRLSFIGRSDRLPKVAQKLMASAVEKTRSNDRLQLTLALSYGGRQEIVHAARRAARLVQSGEIDPEEIDESTLAAGLFDPELPDPDLVIRTGGEHRISNFLLWQIAYSELYISDLYWPDFREKELEAAVMDFRRRQRRFGLTGDQVGTESSPDGGA
jgi:undecaprenyl diphosphate synthase